MTGVDSQLVSVVACGLLLAAVGGEAEGDVDLAHEALELGGGAGAPRAGRTTISCSHAEKVECLRFSNKHTEVLLESEERRR